MITTICTGCCCCYYCHNNYYYYYTLYSTIFLGT